MKQNVLAVYRRATVEQVKDGIGWYPRARSIARDIASGDVERGAGVIAALSPMMPWDRNVALARKAFKDGVATGALTRNCDKATSIVNGAMPLDILGGDKVRAFFANIVD